MPRIRSVKPEFFTDSDLCEHPPLHRLLFQGLWLQADREGRLEDKPRELKVKVLPYDECNVDAMLGDLAATGFIVRYVVGCKRYIFIPGFLDHQHCHVTEKASILPPPPAPPESGMVSDISEATVTPPLSHGAATVTPPEANESKTPSSCLLSLGSGLLATGSDLLALDVHAVSAKPACPEAAPVPEGEGASKPNVVPLGLKPPGVPKPTPLAPEPPPATDKKPQRAEGPGPHQRLLDALVAAFEAERGTRYAVQDGRDGKAVKWLLGAGTETEVLRRWRVGLNGEYRQRIDCIHELQARWNALGGHKAAGAGKDLRKGYADADGRDWTGDGGYGALNKRGAK